MYAQPKPTGLQPRYQKGSTEYMYLVLCYDGLTGPTYIVHLCVCVCVWVCVRCVLYLMGIMATVAVASRVADPLGMQKKVAACHRLPPFPQPHQKMPRVPSKGWGVTQKNKYDPGLFKINKNKNI